ncbi:MAG TPA: biotin transporter BioY [Rhodoglobus sp.]|nr:biotin transporter BioY [Rhodoglobus sp.]
MSTITLAVGRPTLADRVFTRTLAVDLVLIAAGAALTAVAAQFAVPMWPVPITGQTLAVMLVGASLGAVRGALSMVLYLVLGVAGLPVFSDSESGWHVVAGPTGGYIVGFVFAAALTGWLAQRAWDRKLLKGALAFALGSLTTFAFGLPWLAVTLGSLGLPNDLWTVLQSGLFPFIVGGVVKSLLGAGIIAVAWWGLRRSDEQAADHRA